MMAFTKLLVLLCIAGWNVDVINGKPDSKCRFRCKSNIRYLVPTVDQFFDHLMHLNNNVIDSPLLVSSKCSRAHLWRQMPFQRMEGQYQR